MVVSSYYPRFRRQIHPSSTKLGLAFMPLHTRRVWSSPLFSQTNILGWAPARPPTIDNMYDFLWKHISIVLLLQRAIYSHLLLPWLFSQQRNRIAILMGGIQCLRYVNGFMWYRHSVFTILNTLTCTTLTSTLVLHRVRWTVHVVRLHWNILK